MLTELYRCKSGLPELGFELIASNLFQEFQSSICGQKKGKKANRNQGRAIRKKGTQKKLKWPLQMSVSGKSSADTHFEFEVLGSWLLPPCMIFF